MTKYTFRIAYTDEARFNQVLSRIEDGSYNILEPMRPVDHKPEDDARYVDRQIVIEMEEESALQFRMSMRHVRIRHERTEEELAEEKAIHDANTIRIDIQIPPGVTAI